MASKSRGASLYYVLAPSYHGANALSANVNLHEHALSLGNGNPVRNEEQICSCGENVSSFCPFWMKAAEVIESNKNDPLRTLLPQSPYIVPHHKANTALNGMLALIANEVGPKAWKMVYEQGERFYGIHDKFLNFCQEWYPHKVFLDAERSALKFMVMASMDFPVKGVVHLIRDPRGYAAACKKYYPESTAEKLAMEWAATHTRIRRLASAFPEVPFLTIRYEELAEDIKAATGKVFDFMGLKGEHEVSETLDSRKNHMLGLGSGDHAGIPPGGDNWRESLSLEDQERIVRAAGPLFSELGYKS